ncbi:MAG: M3 family metallopeptidase [Verrucomicrobiota bacterium]
MTRPFQRSLFACLTSLALTPLGLAQDDTQPLEQVDDFQEIAAKFNNTLTLPEFPQSDGDINSATDDIIALATRTGDEVAGVKAEDATFENTLGKLDRLYHIIENRLSPVVIVENTSTDPALRKAATEAIKKFEEFSVGFSYRDDIYQAVKGYADTNPELEGEQKKLLEETLRDYRRKGFDLSPEKRKHVEELQKELSKLSTDFSVNIREYKAPVTFTAEELAGLPESFLADDELKTGEDEYTLNANVTYHYMKVIELAESEEARKRMMTARSKLAMEANIPLLAKIVTLRDEIAHELGYKTWADYRTETRMAKNEATVRSFLDELKVGLTPKWEEELDIFQKMKAEDTGDPDAVVNAWDLYYYREKYRKNEFDIDSEALRVYFPYQECLDGMFGIYQEVFGIKIQQVDNPDPWAEGVTLWVVSDDESGEPLGLFFLDMFPRDGKYNHFAQFTIIKAGQIPDGDYQRPTVALICNFPPPSNDAPSLLSPDEVETLFHEFGHVLHSILTRANYASFSGTSVPRDFVEAPSQMLEYWVRDKAVLDLFAADYRDQSKKIPQKVLDNMEAARLATIASHYRRQIGYANTDLALHGAKEADFEVAAATNAAMADAFLPPPDDTAYVAGFGHMMGYDAGYYGYAWADTIAADLASVFEASEDKYLDKEIGRKLRKEIYEPGDSRDVEESVETFLGRPRSLDAFLKNLGIESQN